MSSDFPVAKNSLSTTTNKGGAQTFPQAGATSEISICNEALSAMGSRSRLTSLNENSPQARECALRYTSVRDQLLRGAPWDFAKRTITAGLLKAAPGTEENSAAVGVWSNDWPPPPWLYMYAYPSDCVRVREIKSQPYTNIPRRRTIPFTKALDYDSDGKPRTVILTNEQDALLVYTARVTLPSLYDPLFIEAFVAALASELAIPLSGSSQLSSALAQKANNIILEARLVDGNEDYTVLDHVPDWLQTRGIATLDIPQGSFFNEPYSPLFGGSR